MKNRRLNMVLLSICVALAVASCLLAIARRNEKPYFQSKDLELVYYEGMSEQELLEGLRAYDREDGEITDKILVDSQKESEDDIVVTYVVWDSSHEEAVYTRTYKKASGEERPEDRPAPSVGDEIQEGGNPETSLAQGEPAQEKSSEEESSQEESEAATEEGTQQSEAEGQASQEGEEEPPAENPEAPVLVLKGSGAVISAGEAFRYWDYIESMEDNQDDFEYLSTQIVVTGEYDTSVPGTYELKFWVLDSDGNSSVPQEFQLTVQ